MLRASTLHRASLKQISSMPFSTPASNKGFTLLEVLATVAIATILLFSTTPLVNAFNHSNAVDSTELMNLLHQARKTAVFTESKVIVCPMDESKQCTNNWSLALSSFQDSNANHVFDADDVLLQSVQNQALTVRWNSANNSPFISFNADGGAGENIGKISLMSQARDAQTTILMPLTGQAKIL